jgi:hypothetical protein
VEGGLRSCQLFFLQIASIELVFLKTTILGSDKVCINFAA